MPLRRSAAILALVVAAVGAPAPLPAQAPDSALITTVLGTAMQANLEIFGKDTGEATVGGVALLDIDGDGKPEAFVWLTPTFLQTPTVLVYRLSKSGEPHRLRESLVPGRLQPPSGRLRDSHTMGFAVDIIRIAGSADEARVRSLFIEQSEGLSFVRYSTFVHSDLRSGFLGYTDLSDLKLESHVTSCGDFEFSRVDGLAGGRLAGDSKHRYLVALTQDDVTIYEIDGIREDETLDKERWMRARPPAVAGLGTNADGQVELIHTDGSRETVAKP